MTYGQNRDKLFRVRNFFLKFFFIIDRSFNYRGLSSITKSKEIDTETAGTGQRRNCSKPVNGK